MVNIPVILPALSDATSSLYQGALDNYNSINRALGPSRCGLDYRVDIRPVDCVVAKRQLFSDEALRDRHNFATYYLNRGQDTTFDLPLSRTYGTCTITIDYTIVAPNLPNTVRIGIWRILELVQQYMPQGARPRPRRIRGRELAIHHALSPRDTLYAAPSCPVPAEFALPAPNVDPERSTYPAPGLITVSITKSSTPQKRSGETEAAIPENLAAHLASRAPLQENSDSYGAQLYLLRYALFDVGTRAAGARGGRAGHLV